MPTAAHIHTHTHTHIDHPPNLSACRILTTQSAIKPTALPLYRSHCASACASLRGCIVGTTAELLRSRLCKLTLPTDRPR